MGSKWLLLQLAAGQAPQSHTSATASGRAHLCDVPALGGLTAIIEQDLQRQTVLLQMHARKLYLKSHTALQL